MEYDLLKPLEKALSVLKLVLPYLDRDGDGNSLYNVDGWPKYAQFADLKEDILHIECAIANAKESMAENATLRS